MEDAPLPRRLTTSQVCKLAGFGKRTLARRIASGKLRLSPVDRGREDLYDRDEVLQALGMNDAPRANPWEFNAEAFRKARTRKVRYGVPRRGSDD